MGQLSRKADEKVKAALDSLLSYAESIAIYDDMPFVYTEPSDFIDLQTRFLFLLQMLSSYENPVLNEIRDRVQALMPADISDFDDPLNPYSDYRVLVSLVRSVEHAYQMGLLGDLREIIVTDVSQDYLEQGRELLEHGFFLSAAVTVGAVLEHSLRRMCEMVVPPIAAEKPTGEPKTLNLLIEDLKKTGSFNELKAKQLRAWADVRNAAAHGEFGRFSRSDVEQMLVGIQNFLADFL